MTMSLDETALSGAYLVHPGLHEDERGLFGRVFDAEVFAAQGLDAHVSQTSFSTNHKIHTLRGMHAQAAPNAESKLVSCVRGIVFDVIIDLRPDSPTELDWLGTTLNAQERTAIYIPPGFAHGYVTLTDDTELAYQISTPYHPASAFGVRWDDPAVGISWPVAPAIVSVRDQSYPLLTPRSRQ